jgi:hypothetical protein
VHPVALPCHPQIASIPDMTASLLTLLDDLATLFDDIAVMTRVAAKKTAGVIGDDLALNAEQVTGMHPDRELPVVWAVAKGALINKAILVPAALVISAFVPALIVPLLMLGGAFLCYEGFEKTWHKLRAPTPGERGEQIARVQAVADPAVDLVALEKTKIRGAVRTDFILSAEVIVIALGTMSSAPRMQQFVSLTVIGLGMVALVYGLVAGLVKLDDLGLTLHRTEGNDASAASARNLGAFVLRAAPVLMKALSVLGTAAMFMVGGSILVHGVPAVDQVIARAADAARAVMPLLGTITRTLLDAVAGIVVGGVIVAFLAAAKGLMGRGTASSVEG